MDNTLIISVIKLTIGILVSNRIQYIRKVMEGIRPLLESLPCELIVVDTKGAETDGSIEIVKEYTDKIYPFTWCNDFAAARNVCLEHARGEWFLYLDDDECFDDVTEIITFFQTDAHTKYNSAGFYIRNYEADGQYAVSIVQRFVRRRKNTRFIGAIHEHINEVFMPNKIFNCFIHHYGYAFQTLEEAKKHQQRNVSILRAELDRNGFTPHLCAQMTQELIYLETTTDDGFSFAEKALAELAETNHLSEASAQWIMYATVLYFLRKNEITKAKEQIAFLQKTCPLNEVTCLVFSGILTNLALDEKNIADMLSHSTEYLKLWDWKQANEEATAIQSAFNFPHFYEESYYHKIIHIGAAAANAQEYYIQAKKFWDRLPLGTEGFDAAPYYQDFSATISGLKRVQQLRKNQTVYLQQFELLEQASLQVQQYFKQGDDSSAKEYLSVIQQFIPVVEAPVCQVFGDRSQTMLALREYSDRVIAISQKILRTQHLNELVQDITFVKSRFIQEAKALLSKNT